MTASKAEWEALLNLALPVLDHVFVADQHPARPHWTLGGGTALSLQINHRLSEGIDIFVPDVRLKAFTPAHNPGAMLISPDFLWLGHCLEFGRPEGQIRFLAPGLLTDHGYTWMTLAGRRIAVETPEEIIVKKARYCSESFTPRDAFDLAAVAAVKSDLAKTLANELSDALPRLTHSLDRLMARDPTTLASSIMPLKGFRPLPEALPDAAQAVRAAIQIVLSDAAVLRGG